MALRVSRCTDTLGVLAAFVDQTSAVAGHKERLVH